MICRAVYTTYLWLQRCRPITSQSETAFWVWLHRTQWKQWRHCAASSANKQPV